MMKKKAQAWGLDLIIALVIFIIGVVAFYTFMLNNSSSDEIFSAMKSEGEAISDSLLTEGAPIDWEVSNVNSIGITSENGINESKAWRFYNLSESDYPRTKLIFNLKDEYLVYFSENLSYNGSIISSIGKEPTNPRYIAIINRFTIINDKPSSMIVEIWK